MFTVYVDDSGTSDLDKIAIAAAVIIPSRRLVAYEKEWDLFLKKYEISDLHTAKCAMRNKKSQFAKWSEDQPAKAIARAAQITRKYGCKAFSFAVRKSDYDACVTGEIREVGGKYHYTWAIRHLLSAIETWSRETGHTAPIEYIFDWMDIGSPKRIEVEEIIAQAESIEPGRYADRFSIRRRECVDGLQSADLVAWATFKFSKWVYDRIQLTDVAYDTFWGFEKYKDGNWMYAVAQKRQELIRWAKAEENDVRSQQRRRNWIEAHRKK